MESTAKARIRIRMERPFNLFGYEEKKVFLHNVSQVSGCPEEQIDRITYRSGCVIFEGRMDREAVLRLVELFEKSQTEKGVAFDMGEFQRFLKEHSVSDISSLEPIHIAIKISEKSDPRKLLFVHGWRGDAGSFGVLPEFLESEFKCRSLVYDYPTGFWEKSPSLEFVWRNLDNWIRNNAAGARLAIISHSMGGIVARKCIVGQSTRSQPIDRNVRQMTFVASPHNGAMLASLAAKVPFFRRVQTNEINPNSPFLVNLNDNWNYWAQNNVPKNCTARCIYGTADDVVSTNNAASLDREAVPILNAGHVDIIKPEKMDDEIVRTIARFIRESSFCNE